jgi:hypothetical protein
MGKSFKLTKLSSWLLFTYSIKSKSDQIVAILSEELILFLDQSVFISFLLQFTIFNEPNWMNEWKDQTKSKWAKLIVNFKNHLNYDLKQKQTYKQY